MNKQIKAILRTLCDDARSGSLSDLTEVYNLLSSATFCKLLLAANVPEELLLEIKDGLELSFMQRQVYYRAIMEKIKESPVKYANTTTRL